MRSRPIAFDDAVVFDIPSIRLVAPAEETLREPANLGIIQVPAQITVEGSLVHFSDRQIVEVLKRDIFADWINGFQCLLVSALGGEGNSFVEDDLLVLFQKGEVFLVTCQLIFRGISTSL
jgi:hypothetical protein